MTLFGLTFHPYGTALAVSACLCLLLAAHRSGKAGLRRDTVPLLAPLCLILGMLGAKLFFCLSCPAWFLDKGIGAFFDFSGGFLLYGAMAGCALAAFLSARTTKQGAGKLLDAMAAPGALMIALSRLAEGLAYQGCGWSVEDWFSVDAWDPSEYTGMSLFHLEDASFFERFPFSVADPIYGEYCWSVFLLEALFALLIFLVLIRLPEKRPGWNALLFLFMYAALQCFGESARQDAVIRVGFVRVNQVISALAVVILSFVFALTGSSGAGRPKRVLRAVLPEALMIGIVVAMEFALEKKIVCIAFIPMDVCYLISLVSCVCMILFILPEWKRSRETA